MRNEYTRTGRPDCAETVVPTEMLDFVRYVAGIASKITIGEADPDAVNWRYIRDRAASAMLASESRR